MAPTKNDIELAAKYRRNERPDLQGGVVIIYNGKVTGWTRSLSEPHRFRPGCIAVDATGGDYQNGAARWEPMA